MKQQINEIKRLQQLAGLLKEDINEAAPKNLKEIKGTYTIYQDPDDSQNYYIKFGNEEVDTFLIADMVNGKFEYIGSGGCDCDVFFNALVNDINNSRMTESQMDEAENNNMLTQNDIKALYSKGFNIIAEPDWNFVRIQKDFKSLKADWRFLNNLLSSKNIPSDIDYWRGDGDKGRNKRLEISKKYFDKNIKYPTFK